MSKGLQTSTDEGNNLSHTSNEVMECSECRELRRAAFIPLTPVSVISDRSVNESESCPPAATVRFDAANTDVSTRAGAGRAGGAGTPFFSREGGDGGFMLTVADRALGVADGDTGFRLPAPAGSGAGAGAGDGGTGASRLTRMVMSGVDSFTISEAPAAHRPLAAAAAANDTDLESYKGGLNSSLARAGGGPIRAAGVCGVLGLVCSGACGRGCGVGGGMCAGDGGTDAERISLSWVLDRAWRRRISSWHRLSANEQRARESERERERERTNKPR
jgi:hypothetical protein